MVAVDEATDRLLQLTIAGQQLTDVNAQAEGFGQQRSLKLDVKKSRLPSQTADSGGLLQLSPKTPHILPELLQYGYSSSDTLPTTMTALDSFGGAAPNMNYYEQTGLQDEYPGAFNSLVDNVAPVPHEVHGVGLTPVDSGPLPGSLFIHPVHGLSTIIEHQRTESLSPGSQSDGRVVSPGYGPSLVQQQVVSPSALAAAFPPGVLSLASNSPTSNNNKNSNDSKQQSSLPPKPRGSRKKTLSLNPEEREALENLIEDVIIGGIAGDESSNSSDSDVDAEKSDSKNGEGSGDGSKDGALNKEGLPKIYPAQLKVAVKHMRNLPPRFMRRLENAQKKIDAAEKIELERFQEEQVRQEIMAKEKEHDRIKVRENQKREKKKNIRYLLDDLDQYTDEQSVSLSKDDSQLDGKGSNRREKTNNRHEHDGKRNPEIEGFKESSQPIHVGLSKGQHNQNTGPQPGMEPGVDLTKQFLHGQHMSVAGQGPPPSKALNCEDLERELLGVMDYTGPVSMPMYMDQQHGMNVNNTIPPDMSMLYGPPNICDPMDNRTFLSAEAPEFVPYNVPLLQHLPSQNSQTYQSSGPGYTMQGQPPGIQMQASNPHMHAKFQNSHQASPHSIGPKFKHVPKESPPSATVDMLRTKSSVSHYNQSQMGRLSPQVVTTSMGRLSPQVMPVSSANGPIRPTVPPPSTSQSFEQQITAGKVPTFMVPKVPTNVPPPGTTGGPQHPGVGVMPINPYQIPYTFAPTGFPPPHQGFPPYQPFVPPPGYLPWTDAAPDTRGPIAHHPLMGIPLKASPQLGRKWQGHPQGHPHHGQRQSGPGIRHTFVHHKPAPNDVRSMSTEQARKLVSQLLVEGKKILVMLRGCPGSGKSTLAKEICYEGAMLSTDDYFLTGRGTYEYDISKLSDAHLWNQNRAKQAMESGTNPIIVDNTNSQSWEMKPYVSLATKHNYHVEILEPDTPWKYNAKELAKRNSHGVAIESIRKMLDRYEHSITLKGILGVKRFDETTQPENQQQNHSEDEQQGKKTQRRRKKKKRKRNRHRSRRDEKDGVVGDENKHTSDDSSGEDETSEKHATPLKLLEKRASLSSNETTTSPRETTPEVIDRIEDPWENTFSEIREDFPADENVDDTVVKDRSIGVERLDVDLKEYGDVDKTLASSVEQNELVISVEHQKFVPETHSNHVMKESDSCVVGYSADLLQGDQDALQSKDCAQTVPNDNSDNCFTKDAILVKNSSDKIDESVDYVSDTGELNVEQNNTVTANCDSSANSKLNNEVVTSTIEDVLVTSDIQLAVHASDETINNVKCSDDSDVYVIASVTSCDCEKAPKTNVEQTNSTCDDENSTENSAIENLDSLDIKREVTKILEEHLLQALVSKELSRVIDVTKGEPTTNKCDGTTLLDVVSDAEDGDDHAAAITDLQNALDDIEFDNPNIEHDSDSDLDQEYGLEALRRPLTWADVGVILDRDGSGGLDSIGDLDSAEEFIDADVDENPVHEKKGRSVSDIQTNNDLTPDLCVTGTKVSENQYWTKKDSDPYIIDLNNITSTTTDLGAGDPTVYPGAVLDWDELEDCVENQSSEVESPVHKPQKAKRRRSRPRVKADVEISETSSSSMRYADEDSCNSQVSSLQSPTKATDSPAYIVSPANTPVSDTKPLIETPELDTSALAGREVCEQSPVELVSSKEGQIVSIEGKNAEVENLLKNPSKTTKSPAASGDESCNDESDDQSGPATCEDQVHVTSESCPDNSSDGKIASDNGIDTSSHIEASCTVGSDVSSSPMGVSEDPMCAGISSVGQLTDERTDLLNIGTASTRPGTDDIEQCTMLEEEEAKLELVAQNILTDVVLTEECSEPLPDVIMDADRSQAEDIHSLATNVDNHLNLDQINLNLPEDTITEIEQNPVKPRDFIEEKCSTKSKDSLVQPDVRQKLLGQNWAIPALVMPKSPVPAKPVTVRSCKTSSMSTQVQARDLVFVHKLEQSDLEAVLLMDEYNIQAILAVNAGTLMEGVGEVSSLESAAVGGGAGGEKFGFQPDQNGTNGVVSVGRCGQVAMFHKGSQTEEHDQVQADQKLQEKVTMLQMCFMDTSREDIVHILKQCQGDMEWASNILLDGGTGGVSTQVPPTTDQVHKEPDSSTNKASNWPALPSGNSSLSSHEKLAMSEIDLLRDATTGDKFTGDSDAVSQSMGVGASSLVQPLCPSDRLSTPAGLARIAGMKSPDSLLKMCHKSLSVQGGVGSDGTIQITPFDIDQQRQIDESEHERFRATSPQDLPDENDLNLPMTNHDKQNQNPVLKPNISDSSEFHLPPPVTRRLPGTKSVLPSPTHVSRSQTKDPATEAETDTVTLQLTPQLAQQLIRIFGPVQAPFAPVTLSDEELNVSLDRETARQIHQSWGHTLTQRLGTADVDNSQRISFDEDEALARKLQEEEYAHAKKSAKSTGTTSAQPNVFQVAKKKNKGRNSKTNQNSSGSSAQNSPARELLSPGEPAKIKNGEIAVTVQRVTPVQRALSPIKTATSTRSGDIIMGPPRNPPPAPSLREIMDTEQALENSRLEYLESQEEVHANEGTLSTKLKWQQLIEKFPGVDPTMLNEVFQATGYHMESTVHAVESSLSQQGPVKNVMTAEMAARFEQQMYQQAVEESLQMWPDTEDSPTKEEIYQTLEDPMYSDFRAEASTHYKQRQECFEKAADAYKRGMKDIASYYSQQGHLHTQKLNEANHRAAQKIVDFKNVHLDKTNSIDLHGLHVDEALQVLTTIMAQRETELRERPDKRKSHLTIVTGRGTHSRGGVAKLRPAVLEMLKKNNYRWTETNASMIKVQLKYRDPRADLKQSD